jgi:hypothetical protein
MGDQAEKRMDQRHACKGTMKWIHFNKECYGAAKIRNFSRNGSSFESDLALALGSTVLIHIFKCMNCVDVSKTSASLRWDALAEVKWCQKLSEGENTLYAVGVRYHYPV